MSVILITGSTGLVGSESVRFFCKLGYTVVGIDNDMRANFFGAEASTEWNRKLLQSEFSNYNHYNVDIRDKETIERMFSEYNKEIALIIHAAAQPSHDWAATDPICDFSINANGTLILLEVTRKFCPKAVFIFVSTNKVYGDLPNYLPLIEEETRWEIEKNHPYYDGIDETMSIDNSKHSLFGVSKAAADLLTQEYGKYFGINTGIFRGGCLTGAYHSGAQLHGFLSYLMKCAITGQEYIVFGYKGKQVRDNIHSEDLINAFYHFFQSPLIAEVYNIGGGRDNNCSILEAIKLCEEITGKKVNWSYSQKNRSGDHIWYISNSRKFKNHFPQWKQAFCIKKILEEIFNKNVSRWNKQHIVQK